MEDILATAKEDLEEGCAHELLAVSSIYENEVRIWQDGGVWKVSYHTCPSLPTDFKLYLGAAKGEATGIKVYPVSYLPPLYVDITLPDCYPSKKPPSYTLTCQWLTRQQMTRLCNEMDRQWRDGWMDGTGSVILFDWFKFLEDELFTFLDLKSPLNVAAEEPQKPDITAREPNSIARESQNIGREPRNTASDAYQDSSNAESLYLDGWADSEAEADVKAYSSPAMNSGNITRMYPRNNSSRAINSGVIKFNSEAIVTSSSPSFDTDLETDAQNSLSSSSSSSSLPLLLHNPVPEYYVCMCGEPGQTCMFSAGALGVDCRTVQKRQHSDKALLHELLLFNKVKEREKFEGSTQQCSVCLWEGVGVHFVCVDRCHHTFCKECLASHVLVKVKDSTVKPQLTCLEHECNHEIFPHQIKQVLSAEDFATYDDLALKATLDADRDIVYCPQRHCQTPVVKEGTLGRCPKCYFPFCTTCTQQYHGTKPCPMTSDDMLEVLKRYENGNPATKQILEKRYGKRRLKQAESEASSLEWITKNTMACPQCGSGVEKVYGCNMMTCTCGAHFCWLCGKLALGPNPYDHFLNAGGKCYAKTFFNIDRDENQELLEMYMVPENGLVLLEPFEGEDYYYEEQEAYGEEGFQQQDFNGEPNDQQQN